MKDFEYHSPPTITEACNLLQKHENSARVLAGGTDIIPKMYHHQFATEPEHIINIKHIPELNNITFDEKTGLSLGALVNFNQIIYSDIVQDNYPILKEVSQMIASHQIRNLATVGGNLCNAAPSADSAPILIALDSTVNITGPQGKQRELPLEQFFIGPGTTALKPDEILIKINIPIIRPNTGMAYIKQTTRNALEIALVGVAGLVRLENGSDKCEDARVVVAACAPTPLRVLAAEQTLIGNNLTDHLLETAATAAATEVKPITDVRACEVYRREMVQVQSKRVLEEAVTRAKRS